MNPSIRYCVRCSEEEIPWHGWPSHALEELAGVVGVETSEFGSLHAAIVKHLQSRDPTAGSDSYRGSYDRAAIDALELCIARTLRDRPSSVRICEIADLIPTSRSRQIGTMAPATVAYTVGHAYVVEHRWQHAAWWMAFAQRDADSSAYAEFVQGIAKSEEDVGAALGWCERALEKWPDGLPCLSVLLLCRSLALADNDSKRASRFWAELEERLATVLPTVSDESPAFDLATVGVALVASGDFEAAREYIARAERAHADGHGRVVYLMEWLLHELPPDADEPVREFVLRSISKSD